MLLATHLPRSEVARRLEVEPREVERAVQRLRSVAGRIDREDNFGSGF